MIDSTEPTGLQAADTHVGHRRRHQRRIMEGGTTTSAPHPDRRRRAGERSAARAVAGALSSAFAVTAATRVLVVDDVVEVADIFAEWLQRDGHRVDFAADGAVALKMLAERAHDLVLTDTKMPVLIFLTGDVLSREKREFLERSGRPFS